MCAWVTALLLALFPAVAAAQGVPAPSGGNVPATPGNIRANPSNFPYPTMPWNGATRPDARGQVIGYLEVPPEQVTIAVPAAGPESGPLQLQPQVVTIPGYHIAETTLGYVYPERWTLDQVNVGVYQWRLLPAEFRHK